MKDGALEPAFQRWLRRHGVRHAGLRFESAPGRGVYGVADYDIEAGSVVLAVPKAAMLTRQNAREADALHALLEEGLPSVEVLGLAVALERAAGRKSSWQPYLHSLPPFEPLPLLWSASELRLLEGTGLDESSRRRKRRLADNYRSAAEVWTGSTPLPSLEEYLHASTLASSRAFEVDGLHGEGLLPLCDMLNHKAALVPRHGEDDDDQVEEGDGRLLRDLTLRIPPAPGDEEEDGDDEEEDGDDEEEDGDDEEQDGDDEEEDGDDEEQDGSEAGLVCTARALRAGDEACHTYGCLGNWELLSGYGFTLENNPFDTAVLEWRHVVRAAEKVLGGRRARRGLAALRQKDSGALARPLVFDRRGMPPPTLSSQLKELGHKALTEGVFHGGDLGLCANPTELSESMLAHAVAAQLKTYRSDQDEAPPPSKRRREGEEGAAGRGLGAVARRMHAARLVRGEIAIWRTTLQGGRELDGRELAAAQAGAAARRARLES